LPHRYEALGEALTAGSDVLGACAVAGEDLARDGASMQEALEGMRDTWRQAADGDPSYDAVSTLVTAWSETTLGYLHQLSCDDPLTGLASQAHLRSRISELYRVADASGHALVVVALPLGDDPSDEAGDHFTRAMRIARAGELARTVFPRDETIARLGVHRVGILCRRDERLGRRVRVLATLLEGSPEDGPVRLWIEGLPGTDHFAGSLLDELARG
jgi:GGDEF domain-containing protein